MKHLSTFKTFVRESVGADDIITTGAKQPQASANPDAELDKAAAEADAQAKENPIKMELAKPAPGRTLLPNGTEAVAKWQEKLVAAGYKIAVDGGWGKETQKAYTKFIDKKYGATSTKARKARKGTAPAVAKGSPGADAWSFFSMVGKHYVKAAAKGMWNNSVGGMVSQGAQDVAKAMK